MRREARNSDERNWRSTTAPALLQEKLDAGALKADSAAYRFKSTRSASRSLSWAACSNGVELSLYRYRLDDVADNVRQLIIIRHCQKSSGFRRGSGKSAQSGLNRMVSRRSAASGRRICISAVLWCTTAFDADVVSAQFHLCLSVKQRWKDHHPARSSFNFDSITRLGPTAFPRGFRAAWTSHTRRGIAVDHGFHAKSRIRSSGFRLTTTPTLRPLATSSGWARRTRSARR